MSHSGKVTSGRYSGRFLSVSSSGALAINKGIGHRKVTTTTVASWEVISVENLQRRSLARRTASKTLDSIAWGAFFEAPWIALLSKEKSGRFHNVKLDWFDGGHSLVQLPESLYVIMQATLGPPSASSTSLPPGNAARLPLPPPTRSTSSLPNPTGPTGPTGPIAQTGPGTTATSNTHDDVIEQIARLATLRDRGALTEDEFLRKKTDLLSRL